MEKHYFSRLELYIIAQYARYMQISGEGEAASSIFQSIISIIERESYDRSEMELHYRHVGFWLMKYYMDKQDYKTALDIGEKTKQHTIGGGFIKLLSEIIENIVICKEHMGIDITREKSHVKVLKRYVYKYCIQTSKEFFPRYNEQRVYNVNDVILQRRKMRGLKQEQILGEDCSRRTINRIESHRATTRRKTKVFLLEQLKFPLNKYIGAVDTHDYTVFKLYNKVRDLVDLED